MIGKLTTAAALAALLVPAGVRAQDVAADEAQQALEGTDAVDLSEYSYDEIYQQGWSAQELLDAPVDGPEEEDIGEVENIIVGPDGNVISIIAEIGGLFDLGDTHINVPWDRVEASPGMDDVAIPITDDTVGEFSFFPEAISGAEAESEIAPVNDDLNATERAFRVTELIGDYVRLEGGENYGYVRDLIFDQGGKLMSVVVQPDVGYGGYTGGYYAYPYYGYGYGMNPGSEYYDLPYNEDDIGGLDRFDYGSMGEGM